MFYYLVGPYLLYNVFLIAAAVIPAVLLLRAVYRMDRLEKESRELLRSLVIQGVLAALLALVEEKIGGYLLDLAVSPLSPLYNVLLYFVVVAVSEETSKYLLMKRKTWKNPEFNCQYDGVVYGVFISLGFAIWENISYVLTYGFSTALVRAVTAIPGHACFGVFMGAFYGMARRAANSGNGSQALACRIAAVIVPVLLHGTYDYIATVGSQSDAWYFFAFIALLFAAAYFLIRKMSRDDRYIA